MSPSCKKFTGYGPEEFIKDPKLLSKIVHPEDQAFFDSHFELTGSDKPHEIDFRIATRDGRTRWISHACQPVFDDEGKWLGRRVSNRDITERKKVEGALKESEEMLKKSQEIIHLGSWKLNLINNVLFWSDEVYRIFGLKPQEFSATYEAFLEAVHPDDRKKVDDAYSGSLREGKDTYEVEHRVIRKSTGEIRTVQERCYHIRDAHGRIIQSIGIVNDITERKKAEEEVARLASLPQLNPNPVVEIDLDGKMHYSNPATDLMLPGLKESGLDHPFFGNWEDVVQQFQSGKENFSRDIRVGDHWFYQQFYLVPETRRVRIYMVNIDSLKQTENELRETRDYLDNLLNCAHAPIIVWNLEFKITKFNHAFENLTGLRANEAIGKPFDILFPKNRKDEAMAHIRSTVAGEYLESVEIPILHKDGTVRTLLWNSANIFDASGQKVVATIAQGQDITERKRLEEQLRNAERFSAIGQTAAMVGHDLRNPLQAIVGFIGVAEERLDGMNLSSAEKQEIDGKLRAISDQIHYMNKIVLDLQDYAQPIKPALARTDVRQLITETLAASSIPENVTVSIDIPKNLPKMKIDATILRRVLTNLIANAVQAMLNGGKLNLKASRKTDPQTLVISVEDTGIGIPKADRLKVFTPLFTTKSKGQGFGLPVCKRLLEAQGGTITFKSHVGRGSKFTITMPLTRES